MHPTQNLKSNIALDFIFVYGCTNLEVSFIRSKFQNLEGYFCISFKLLDGYIRNCAVNGVED